MTHKVLLEASGSLTSSYLIKSFQECHVKVVGSDITECAASHIADEFIILPYSSDPTLWDILKKEIHSRNINVVIPSFDETLLEWAQRKRDFLNENVHVILSDASTLEICQDKWNTYLFFKEHDIPTPASSLRCNYPLVKPRLGRGGKGITILKPGESTPMEGMISQELITGTEYTIDVFCTVNNQPVYIIPRKRLQVKDGKSIHGITVAHPKIESLVKRICAALPFYGPINLQCFETSSGDIIFTEINPRIAGGMALGFAASENWAKLILSGIIEKKEITPKPIRYGLKMFRYYDEVFAS